MYQFFPVPSCRMGALWTLSDIENACILEFGPAGTTHFSLEGMSNINGSPKAHALSTHIREHDLTFGKTERLEAAILELDASGKHDVIFVMASTLTAIIGIDLESTCDVLQPNVKATLIPVKSDGFKGDFTYGVKEILTLLAKKIVKSSDVSLEKTYNIVGSTMDEFSSKSDVKAIKRLMKDVFNATCHVVFTSDSSMNGIAEAGKAELNIAMRSEAIEACKILNKTLHMPYVTELPYGLSGIESFCKAVSEHTGWHINQEAYKKILREMNLLIYRIKNHVLNHAPKVLVSGSKDTVLGILNLLNECGIKEARGIVGHKLQPMETFYPISEGVSESVKREILESFSPDIIFGDGVLLDFAKKICPQSKGIQISNPNLDRVLLHHEVPHMGADGIRYIGEKLF